MTKDEEKLFYGLTDDPEEPDMRYMTEAEKQIWIYGNTDDTTELPWSDEETLFSEKEFVFDRLTALLAKEIHDVDKLKAFTTLIRKYGDKVGDLERERAWERQEYGKTAENR